LLFCAPTLLDMGSDISKICWELFRVRVRGRVGILRRGVDA